MEEKKVSIQKSIIWNSAGSMVYLITQWLISVLVVRLSGVETAGILTLAMSVNNVFYSIAMQGIRNYQVSDMKEKYTSGIYVSSRLIICILSFLVCVGYALIAGYSYGSSLCIVAYCLFKMGEAFYDVRNLAEKMADGLDRKVLDGERNPFICGICGGTGSDTESAGSHSCYGTGFLAGDLFL